jgi:hypothetical protein
MVATCKLNKEIAPFIYKVKDRIKWTSK